MAKLINRVLLKYLLVLILSLFGSMLMAVLIHFLSHYFINEHKQKHSNLTSKIDISRYVVEDISSVYLKLLNLTASTTTKQERESTIIFIKTKVTEIENNIIVLNEGGVFKRPSTKTEPFSVNIRYSKDLLDENYSQTDTKLDIKLTHIPELVDRLSHMLNQRDDSLSKQNKIDEELVKQIRTFNANLSTIFANLKAEVTNTIAYDNAFLIQIQETNTQQEKTYHIIETLIILFTAGGVLYIVYRIVQQIINLYKDLENQLYIDAPTKLKNRFALLRDIAMAENPKLAIIDINSFRTINELYGVPVGNEVLLIFANILKQFSKNRDFTVYRISGDEFVFFQDSEHLTIEHFTLLLDKFFVLMENKKIYVAQLDECVYLELNVGISFEKENVLGTADIALHKAKQLHAQYIFYHSELDAVQEIKQGAFWKKRIIAGIEDNDFVPFFQPIVDKQRNIVKYEALMRLKQTNNDTVSFISPFDFLEIASKTRHYDQISKMTLMKSFLACSKIDVPISVNLNYHDIINESLHVDLKKVILNLDIGKKLIFEIVESQDIKNYSALKEFMTDFQKYGVRFAIDDFGTGFSNFSHIFELSPDFIKIDGSLIKNIHIDKKSYELVKAIVFFSKQLGIETIAEFVHSREVFEVAYRLGIDYFQGYYFGEPKEEV